MKKLSALFLIIVLLFGSSHAESKHFYQFADFGAFSFVCPYGFFLQSDENGVQKWSNNNGDAFVAYYEYIPEWSAAFAKSDQDALSFVEYILVTTCKEEKGIVETIAKEKSGGCFKILCAHESTGYLIHAVCPYGLLTVQCGSLNRENAQMIAEGIYRAILNKY